MIKAIIPMKGNSQRLPNKNVINFFGKPLFYQLLNTLSKSNIDKIIVDTDSYLIGSLVLEYFPKIEVSPRPVELRDELIGGNALLERFITEPDDIYIQSHITSPFLSKESIDKALDNLIFNKSDSIFSVTSFYQKGWFKKNNILLPINHNDGTKTIRTQDMSPVFIENGAFFMFKGSFFIKNKSRNNKESFVFELKHPETIDIDTLEDLEYAKYVYTKYNN